jgi:hypothetical protein
VAKHNERKKGVNTVALNNDKWFTIIATFCVIVNRTDGTSRQVNIFKLTFFLFSFSKYIINENDI